MAGETILLVDDEEHIQQTIGKRLEVAGYRVLQAWDGEQALAMAREQHPDCILLDILMPKLKGTEVLKRLKADDATRTIPVIMLTAVGLTDYIKASMEWGANDYVIKPFRYNDLIERLQVCLLRNGVKA